MNREILFKAKRRNWKELPKEQWWVEGYYRRIPCMGIFEHYILPQNPKNRLEQEAIDVITLSQYTGLIDKYNRKIWENDIVKWRFKRVWKEDYHVSQVVWDSFYSAFKLKIHCNSAKMRKDVEYKVIGNTFDNTDLLEVD